MQMANPPPQKRLTLRNALLFLAGLVGIITLVTTLLALIGIHVDRTPAQHIDAAVNADPRASAALHIVETSFPADYANMRARLIAASAPGMPPTALRYAMRDEMRSFLNAHRSDMARAPAAQLVAIRTAQLSALETMQRDSFEQCAQAATGTDNGTTPPSPAAADAMIALVTAQVRAVAAGARSPSLRAPAPRDADSLALFTAMRRLGASEADIGRLVGARGLIGAPAADKCRIALLFSRALLAIPAESADRISAAVITAS